MTDILAEGAGDGPTMTVAPGTSAPEAAPAPAPSRPTQAPPDRGDPARVRAPSRRSGAANILFGRKLRTDQEMHERLSNPIALAVFASDALSSVAYATEEMLGVLLLAGAGSLAFGSLVPLSAGIVLLLVILVFSYRQTIKAYPSAGGAYIVTRDNFGLLPAQVAGVALLTDYILTVAVSVSAGVAAMYSAAPSLYAFRVPISVALIWLIAWMNLRGVRESGRIFAVPTYVFVVSILALVVIGMAKAATGDLNPIHGHAAVVTAGGSVGLFLLLHAFASGSTAMTGVEAISNGVPAFKPVEWKNARKVMAVLGILLGTMFLGISYLASVLKPVPSEKETVISQITRAIVGSSPLGNAAFLVVQAATMLILVLAANTSFADFPRLASFHAHDHFLPTPLTRRGRRLVFGNGIIALAALSTLLTIVFRADVHNLIPLYAIGVFTSFTLSQAGMARRHLTIKEEGWKLGLFINGIGAIATGVVGVVIAVTKFTHGAWIIMVIVPITVAVLVRVNRHYDSVAAGLNAPDAALAVTAARLSVVVAVSRVDVGLEHAMRYVEHLGAESVRAVHVGSDDRTLGASFWARYGRSLEFVPTEGGLVRSARSIVRAERAEHPGWLVAVVVPEVIESARFAHVLRHNAALRLKAGMLFEPGVVVVNVPTVADSDSSLPSRPPRCHVALVPVSQLHAGAREALRVADIIRPDRVRAVHAAESAEDAEELEQAWLDAGIPVPLDVVAAPYRDVGDPLLLEVEAVKAEGADLVTVVIGEYVPKWWQHGLHNHRALQIKAKLLFEPDVAVVSVPHHLD